MISERSTIRLKSPPIEISERMKKNMTQQSLLRLPTFKSDEEHKTNTPHTHPKKNVKETEKKLAEIQIKAIYDRENQLVELKFTKCQKQNSRKLFKVLQYIISYFPYLTSLIVKQNINGLAIYEIFKLLQISNITEVTLDGCAVQEGNYYILVQELDKLNKLSLARCSIDDGMVRALAANLSYPHIASRTLHILNLSSNIITDEGAAIFAETLRTNRKLYYLNLAANLITDDGAFAIFKTFLDFPLNPKEREDFRMRHWDFVKTKNELTEKFLNELKLEEESILIKADIIEKSVEKEAITKKAHKIGNSVERIKSKTKVKTKNTPLIYKIDINEKAMAMAEKTLADHEEPFANVYTKDNILHFSGNHTVRILNLSYNSITYLSLKKLLQVLEHQKLLNRDPIGLVNVCIEGNYLPKTCMELQLIDEILNDNMPSPLMKFGKKRNSHSARSSITNTSK